MLMVGVSTGQNITNLIPAVQNNPKIKKFLILETSGAIRANWSAGLKEVLAERGIEVEILDLSKIEETSIIEVKKLVKAKLESVSEPIVFNLGGGQKPQQIPLWEIFAERGVSKEISDVVCYAGQPKVDYYQYENKKLIFRSEDINVNLSAKEIFKVFGFVETDSFLIYKKGESVTTYRAIPDLMKLQDFREYLFKLSNKFLADKEEELPLTLDEISLKLKGKSEDIKKDLLGRLNSITDKSFNTENKQKSLAEGLRAFLIGKTGQVGQIYKWLKTPPTIQTVKITPELKNILGSSVDEIEVTDVILKSLDSSISKTADYFEKIVIQRVKSMLENSPHQFIEAFANYKIAPVSNPGIISAEYDVLCVTNKGTIIAFDAKTFDFTNKDLDARLYNLEKGSGFYRNFSAVIPLNLEDIGTNHIPKRLIDLTFALKKRNTPFYVVNDGMKTSFWLKKSESSFETSITKPNGAEWIECKPLSEAIK